MRNNDEIHIVPEVLESEFAPLPVIEKRLLPNGIKEEELLKLFIALSSPECPIIGGFLELGFNLEVYRKFLSLYAGTTLRIPSKKVWSKVWVDMYIWMSIKKCLEQDVAIDEACIRVSQAVHSTPISINSTYTRIDQLMNMITERATT